jgi:segregation and condensation protein B
MRRNSRQPAEASADQTASDTNNGDSSPLSLSRLRDAFAKMLGPQAAHGDVPSTAYGERASGSATLPAANSSASSAAAVEISPRSIVEAILFVGRPDNRPFSARELAAAMRGVSPTEIDAAVAELNAIYEADGAPYRIEGSHSGYRLELREEFGRLRDKLNGRVREAKLSPAAVEVLSVLAYNQPLTLQEINDLRGSPSGAVLSTLVRRGLVRLERSPERGGASQYWTSDRFLKLFGLENLSALPRSEDLARS